MLDDYFFCLSAYVIQNTPSNHGSHVQELILLSQHTPRTTSTRALYPSPLQNLFLPLNRPLPVTLFPIGSAIFQTNLFLYKYSSFSLLQSHFIQLPMKMERIECSETSAYKIQTPENYPKENIQYSEHGESLKSRMYLKLNIK